MDQHQATALTVFVNDHDNRFRATMLTVPLESRVVSTIVILTDRNTGGNPPFLVDTQDYRTHLQRYGYGNTAVEQFETWLGKSVRTPQPKIM